MYEMRERMAAELGFELLVYKNPEAEARGINPFDHGALHTDLWKTEGLKQALDKWRFDAAFGGARRDEEKSRAKERVVSVRSASHGWDPKSQRPELWKLYNTRISAGQSLRVFPISNWTELDVWQYIHLEGIPIVPLYFAAERPVVERDGALIMVDDDRMRFLPGETPTIRKVRFGPGLLSAHRRGGERRRHPAGDHPGNAADHHLRAPGPGDRPRPDRLDGEEEARGVFLMASARTLSSLPFMGRDRPRSGQGGEVATISIARGRPTLPHPALRATLPIKGREGI